MTSANPDQPTFGARFLEEWKRRGGPMSAWSYAEIQEVRVSDREGMVRSLRTHQPLIGYAALQRIRNVESPEVLAGEMLTQAQAAANMSVWMMFALLT